MLGENKNLKDPERKPLASYGAGSQDMSVTVTYPKTNKLITALYMVTDIMENDEPLRIKLRTLGANIISDIYSLPVEADKKIVAIISLLDIASAINLISEMNCTILKKEFLDLKESIQESKRGGALSDFFLATPALEAKMDKGHIQSTRIGVQKGSTLMKALNRVEMSDRILTSTNTNFDVLKKQRRDEIIKIVREKKEATITDIRGSASGVLASCGEKTLQRELVSMVKDNVLKKFGEKRWSKYSL